MSDETFLRHLGTVGDMLLIWTVEFQLVHNLLKDFRHDWIAFGRPTSVKNLIRAIMIKGADIFLRGIAFEAHI